MSNTETFDFTTKAVNRGRVIRSVVIELTHVAAPGTDWTKDGPRRVVELTSFRGNAVEVYVQSPSSGIMMHQGTINDYAPGSEGGECTITATFAAAWFAAQKSAAAREAFRLSCSRAS